MSAGEQGFVVVMDANILNPTILGISFHHWNSWEGCFWKHFSLPSPLIALSLLERLAEREILWLRQLLFSSSPCPDGSGLLRSSRCGGQAGVDRAEVRARRRRSGEQDSLNWGCNVVRVESVTQLIACWWLRVVSAVSSLWFMDSQWTPAGSEVGKRGRSQPHHRNRASIFFFFFSAERERERERTEREGERERPGLHFSPSCQTALHGN